MSDDHTYSEANHFIGVPGQQYSLPLCTKKVSGLNFAGWQAITGSLPDLGKYTEYGEATLYQPVAPYTLAVGEQHFVARYDSAHISLEDDGDNGQTLALYNGQTVASVTLSGRTLEKNGNWTSLCLPFDLDAEQLAASPLAGCELKTLDTEHSRLDSLSGKIYVHFIDATTIEAGKPYLIRWTQSPMSNDQSQITNPVFRNVTISAEDNDACAERLTFKGTFSQKTYDESHPDIRFIAPSGALMQPDGDNTVTIGACRAYFRLNND